MALEILKERGTPLDKQEFDWKDLVQMPYSKLDDDAFTRVRVILMNGLEAESCASSTCARGSTRRSSCRSRASAGSSITSRRR